MYTTKIPGSPLPFVTTFPIYVKLVPLSMSRIRPGNKVKSGATRRVVQHETGNLNSMAATENAYLLSGAENRYVSYHFVVDDTAAYCNIPVDEWAWHAADGNGPGNTTGVAIELCVHKDILNSGARLKKSRNNAEELTGNIVRVLKVAKSNIDQHNEYSGKDCPHYIRANRYWSTYVESALMFSGGTTDTPTPELHAEPMPIKELAPFTYTGENKPPTYIDVVGTGGTTTRFNYLPVMVEAEVDTPRLQYADKDGPVVGEPIKAGHQFRVLCWYEMADGARRFYTPYATRVDMNDCRIVPEE